MCVGENPMSVVVIFVCVGGNFMSVVVILVCVVVNIMSVVSGNIGHGYFNNIISAYGTYDIFANTHDISAYEISTH